MARTRKGKPKLVRRKPLPSRTKVKRNVRTNERYAKGKRRRDRDRENDDDFVQSERGS